MSGISLHNRITDRNDNSINLYFKDVSRYPLLTPEEEKEVARKVKEGDKKAIDKLITSNLRFVITVAKQYQGKGIPLVDLIGEGNKGLIHSISHFDPDKGFRFMSYAIWWVRQAIVQALSNNSRTIRVPYTKATNLHKIMVAKGKYEQETGEEPSLEKLSQLTNISIKDIKKILDAPRPTVSLETPFTSDAESGNLLDVTPNQNTLPSDNELKKDDLKKIVSAMIDKVDNRTHDVLIMYFGLKGLEPMTLKDISTRFNFTEERARQLKNTALKKFRERYSKILKKQGYG